MKTKSFFLTLLGTASLACAGEVQLESCPPAVRQTIEANLRDGTLDEIDEIKVEDRALYVAEVDLPNGRDLKVHVNGEGKLLKTVEDIATADFPTAVTEAAGKLTAAGGRVDDPKKEVAEGKTTYRMEIDRSGAPDLDVVIDEAGGIVRQTEEIED